jgi:cytochrome c oxidase subunit 6a
LKSRIQKDFAVHFLFHIQRLNFRIVLIFAVFLQISARCLASRSAAAALQRRSATTVPRYGSEEAMKKDALEQIQARLAYQKELKSKHGGHSHAEEVDEMWKWVKISFAVGFPICFISSMKDVLFGEHDHAPHGPLPDYMKIRTKAFPWECDDCALFDSACWKACKAEKALGN